MKNLLVIYITMSTLFFIHTVYTVDIITDMFSLTLKYAKGAFYLSTHLICAVKNTDLQYVTKDPNSAVLRAAEHKHHQARMLEKNRNVKGCH